MRKRIRIKLQKIYTRLSKFYDMRNIAMIHNKIRKLMKPLKCKVIEIVKSLKLFHKSSHFKKFSCFLKDVKSLHIKLMIFEKIKINQISKTGILLILTMSKGFLQIITIENTVKKIISKGSISISVVLLATPSRRSNHFLLL